MGQIIYQGKLYSTFEGFNQNAIFKMNNGTYWVQAQYRYWYHYKYRPDVTIVLENGQYIMFVEGQSIQVRRLYDVIESNIDGAFEGWNGDTVYRLMNGQTWKQKEYNLKERQVKLQEEQFEYNKQKSKIQNSEVKYQDGEWYTITYDDNGLPTISK